jgi:DNA adenine methylase
MFDPIKRAWAVWTLASQSFEADFLNGYATDKIGRTTKTIKNKRESFSKEYAIRL